MIVRGKPKSNDLYLIVDPQVHKILEFAGFTPVFLYKNKFYYLKDDKIKDFIRKEGNKFE